MKYPPLFLKFVFANGSQKGLRLWIPIFLLLPLIYLFLTLLAALLFLLNINRKPKYTAALVEPFRMFNATKGLSVDVSNSYFKCVVMVT